MSYDFLGQLLGKERRRSMEAQAAGLVKPVKIALPVIGSRLAAVGLASILSAAIKNGIPHDAQSAAIAGSGALTAVLLAAPDAFQASGLMRSVSPGTASLLEAAGTAVKAAVAAPANARKAAFSQAVQAEVQSALEKTGQFASTPQGLAPASFPEGLVPVSSPPAAAPAAASTPEPTPAPESAPEASAGASATNSATNSATDHAVDPASASAIDSAADPAVAATGGNQ